MFSFGIAHGWRRNSSPKGARSSKSLFTVILEYAGETYIPHTRSTADISLQRK